MRLASALLLFASTTANAAITGTLIDDKGAPIAGATVRAYAAEDSRTARLRMLSAEPALAALATVKSAENGTFRVEVKAPRVQIAFEAAGKRPAFVESPDGTELHLLVLRGGPARILRLTDGAKPVANAMVFSGPFALKSDAEGLVEMPDALGGVGSSYVVHPDFAPAVAGNRGDEAFLTSEQRLSRGVALRGRVLAADGAPMAGATISVDGWPLAISIADGTFNVVRAPSTARSIVATAGTRAGSGVRDGTKTIDIKLKPAAAISGTSAPGARVTTDDAERGVSVIADSSGKYTITSLPAGRYSLLAARYRFPGTAAAVTVAEGARATRAVSAVPPATVRGVVVDEAGKPVENAFVTTRGEMPRQFVRTNAAGQFLSPRNGERVTVFKSGYAAGAASAPGNSAKSLTITLPRGFPLEVRVVDRREQPLESISVYAGVAAPPDFHEVACEEAPLSNDCRLTQKNGAVRLRTTENEHNLMVFGPQIARVTRHEVITAKSSPMTIVADIASEISGVVRFNDRTPVTNATVVALGVGGFARVADDGSFVLKNLPPGSVRLMAMIEGRQNFRTEVDTTAPAKDVVITMPNPSRIEGRVTEREGGKPVTEFQVAFNMGGRGMATGTPVQSENGTYALDLVPAGSISIVVTAPGYTRATLSNITVEEGKTVSGVDVQLDKGGQVRGRVTSKGQPVSGVTINNADRVGMPLDRTDENGEYFVDNLPPGEQSLRFNKEGFVSKRKSVEVTRGKEARLDVELDAGLEIHGKVVDKSGSPVAGARISVQSNTEGRAGMNVSDASGQFRVSGLEEGHYRITARKAGFTEGSEEVTVPATASITLTVDTGGTITGRVNGLTGSGIVRVWASGPGTMTSTTVNADGSFTLRGVADGRVSVSAAISGPRDRRVGPKTVEVSGGSAPFVELDFNEGFVVSGRVTRSGVPVTSGNVNFQPQGAPGRNAQLNADGTYEVGGLTAGEHRVVVFSAGGPIFTGRYTVASSATYDIRIEGATVRGRVIDSATSMPVGEVNVFIASSRNNPVGRTAVSDSEGRFTLEALPPGTYELRTTSRQSYAPATTTVTVAGEGTQDVEVRLTRAQPTTFRVTDSITGAPVDASIVVSDGTKMIARVQGRDDDGAIRVYVAPGSYRATVNARAYVQSAVQFTVPGPEVRVQLTTGARLVLVANTRLRVRVTGGPRPYNSFATPAGTSIDSMPPGNFTVEVLSDDGKKVLRTFPVTLIAGQTATVNVE